MFTNIVEQDYKLH